MVRKYDKCRGFAEEYYQQLIGWRHLKYNHDVELSVTCHKCDVIFAGFRGIVLRHDR